MKQKEVKYWIYGLAIIELILLILLYSSFISMNNIFVLYKYDKKLNEPILNLDKKIEEIFEISNNNFLYLNSNFSEFKYDVINSQSMVIGFMIDEWTQINKINETQLQEKLSLILIKCNFNEPERELKLFQSIEKDKIILNLIKNESDKMTMIVYYNNTIFCKDNFWNEVDCLTLC